MQIIDENIINLISENNIILSMQILEICRDKIFSEVKGIYQIWFTKSIF